tara:strand:- start:1499 stop:1603 length:105 start_codon:yes stop_codon:yes gene_type:complete
MGDRVEVKKFSELNDIQDNSDIAAGYTALPGHAL